jgi:hypothetical protein
MTSQARIKRLQAARSKRWRDKNPDYFKTYVRKPLTDAQKARKLETNKIWRKSHVTRIAIYLRENRDRHNARRRRRFKTDAVYRAKEKERKRLWKLANASKIRAYEESIRHEHRINGRYDPRRYRLNKAFRNFAKTLAGSRARLKEVGL